MPPFRERLLWCFVGFCGAARGAACDAPQVAQTESGCAFYPLRLGCLCLRSLAPWAFGPFGIAAIQGGFQAPQLALRHSLHAVAVLNQLRGFI